MIASRPWLGRLMGSVLVTQLTACSIPDRFVGRAVDYNRSVEEAENQGLLLNVLRASMDRPLYLTALAQVRGSMTATTQVQTSAGVQLGSNVANPRPLSITPTFTLANGPSFDLAILNSKEFANGFLAPIDLGMMQLLTRADPDLRRTLFLFIEEIAVDLVERDGTIERFRLSNDPVADPEDTVFFGCVVDFLDQAGLGISLIETEQDINVTLAPGQVGNAAEIADALQKGIRFQVKGDRLVLRRKQARYGFTFAEAGYTVVKGKTPKGLGTSVQMAAPTTSSAGSNADPTKRQIRLDRDGDRLKLLMASGDQVLRNEINLNELCPQRHRFADQPAAKVIKDMLDGFVTAFVNAERITLNFYARSTAGVIQAAGRAVRFAQVGADQRRQAELKAFDPLVPEDVAGLIKVEHPAMGLMDGCPSSTYWVCVDYDGETWAVNKQSQASVRTLAVLQQLITLNKSRADTPVTSAVTVVGAGAAGAGL